MKVIAHIVIQKGHELAIDASQFIGGLLEHCDDYNAEYFGEQWRTNDMARTVVTVEFEVPDSVFKRQPTQELPGKIKEEQK